MKIQKPIISIIIPTYNREEFISDALNSVKKQTLSNWECIVVDDGSDDNTTSIVRGFIQSDKRIKLFHRNRLPKGAGSCRNIGIENSIGRYLIFLDSDDFITETCFEQRVNNFEKTDNIHLDFIVFQMLVNKSNTNELFLWNIETKEPDINRFFKLDSVWSISGPIWKREAILKINGFNEELKCWQDVELHIKALLFNLKYKKEFSLPPDSICRKHNQHSISQGNLNIPQKIESRIKLYNWSRTQIVNIRDEAKSKALNYMFFSVAFSLGTIIKPIKLTTLIFIDKNYKFLSMKELYTIYLNTSIYFLRLYKFNLFRILIQNAKENIIEPNLLGKIRYKPTNENDYRMFANN